MLGFVATAFAVTVEPGDIGEAARYYLESRAPLPREDCSGLVEAVHALAGKPIRGSVRTLWAEAVAEGRVHDDPRVGDVVFFDHTFDADRDGRRNDELTHVAVVVRIDDDGTVVMAHRARTAGIEEIRLHPDRPDVYRDGERVLNDYLAVKGWAGPGGARLTGQLLHGYAAFADTIDVTSLPAVAEDPPGRGAPAAPQDRDDPVTRAVALGQRLKLRDLADLPCAQVGVLRDVVYARHGYVFRDAARNVFDDRWWYAPEIGLDADGAARALTARDRYNLDVLEAKAAVCGP